MNIAALGYVTIESTDLHKWLQFATQVLGLMVASDISDDRNLYLKMDDYHYRWRITLGKKDRFLSAGWELPGKAAFAEAVQQLQRAGVSVEIGSDSEAQLRKVRSFARYVDPVGRVGEIFYGMRLDYLPLISPAGVRRFITGYSGDMGLGHIAMATPDLEKSLQFYTEVMGFGQTDYMHIHETPDHSDAGHGLHFLHVNNPRHHSLALYHDSKEAPGELVHLMLEVEDLDRLGLMADRARAHNVKIVTDMGRHTNDRMVSVYVETPAGFALEYGFGGVQLNWAHYLPTESARTSIWGHRWEQGG
jgi:3,4-dihydroxy-9,10-secoandrosta-1,3,5(10)-triene-9,17-dione 4,5-dioxygenase